jgi:Protein of unknown function (DUF3551)
MRHVLTGIGALIAVMAATLQPAPAVEQPCPWCLEGGVNHGSQIDCSYYTIAQCKASGGNGAAACYPNNILLWGGQGQSPQQPAERPRGRERRAN